MKKQILFISLLVSIISFQAQITINEISPNKGLVDEESEEQDWFEIYNAGNETVDLSDYSFTDDSNEPNKWVLPAGNIGAGEFLLFYASGKDRNIRVHHWETIIHNDDMWNYFPGTSEPDANWTALGYDDSAWLTAQGGFGYGDGDDNTELAPVTSVYMRATFDIADTTNITWLMIQADYDDAFVAYVNGIELGRSYNIEGYPPAYDATANDLHEANLYLGEQPEIYGIPKQLVPLVLNPGENVFTVQVHNESEFSSDMSSNFFLSVGISNDDYAYTSTPDWFVFGPTSYHTNFKLSEGETLSLYDSEGILVDEKLIESNVTIGLTTGRMPDGEADWCLFDTASPEQSNDDSWCYDGVETHPVVALESGFYQGAQTVAVSPGSGTGIIRYTTNGDVPTAGSPVYTNPITINENSVFSVKAFSTANLLPSKVVDRTYFINDLNHNLPVFSVITNPDNLWDWETGIYVDGPNADLDNYPYYGANFWEPWSRWSRLEYFDRDGIKQAEEQFDLEIHGGWSRAEEQKSFRFDFKSSYTGDLEYPVIPDKSYITSFNNLNLRNGGQHVWNDKIQDAFIGRLVSQTNVDYMGYEPALLFLNGEYWGLYGIREKIDERYVQDNHFYDKDEVDLLNSWSTLAGTDTHLFESLNILDQLDANSAEFYPEFDSRFDILNYTDYFITETYAQNLDWMGTGWGANNTKLWHPQEENAKWRFVLYDTDACFGFFGTNPWQNFIDMARNPVGDNPHSQMFDKVLQNEEFMHYFVNRYADLMNTTFQPQNFYTVLNGMSDDIAAAIPEHSAFWQYALNFEDWENSMQEIMDYNFLRLGTSRFFVNQEFDLDGQVDVTLDVEPSGAGRIKISTITPAYYPWDGVYYNGCPVAITAIPNPGYTFDHWEENAFWTGDNTNQGNTLNIDQDETFTAVFVGSASPAEIEISEINYNSHNTRDAGDWLEIHNTSDSDIDLSGWILNDFNTQFSFEFPLNTVVVEGEYLVIVRDETKFNAEHPSVSNYITNLEFNLANEGETLYLSDHEGNEMLSVTYDNNNPWPQGARGNGRTLELENSSDYSNPENWFDGCMFGSPGEAYSACSPDLVFSEINYNSLDEINPYDWVEIKNVSGNNIDVSNWIFSDSNPLNQFVINDEISIEADDHLVLTQNLYEFASVYSCHVVGNTQGPLGFGLSSNEENLFLYNQNGLLMYSMNYKSDNTWPQLANGFGMTLELSDENGNPNDGNNWFVGCPQGSPTIDYDNTCSQSLSISITENAGTLDSEVSGGTEDYSYEWFIDDTSVENSSSIVLSVTGTYVLVVTDATGCVISSIPFVYDPNGIESLFTKLLDVSPNPSNGIFSITGMESIGSIIRIQNTQGEIVFEKQAENKSNITLDCSHLAKGVYFVEVLAQHNRSVSKVVIQ